MAYSPFNYVVYSCIVPEVPGVDLRRETEILTDCSWCGSIKVKRETGGRCPNCGGTEDR